MITAPERAGAVERELLPGVALGEPGDIGGEHADRTQRGDQDQEVHIHLVFHSSVKR